ncbi:MAG: helix-turn-helix domain-containing protein [Patescibacteria group bacterium]
MEQDRELRTRSDLAQKTYQNIPQGEKERLEESFLIKSGGTIKKVGGSKKKFKGGGEAAAPSTYDQTLALILAKKSLTEIADERMYTLSTIMNHLEKLAEEKKITRQDIEPHLTSTAKESIKEINKLFDKLSKEKLTPVFEALSGTISYEDLRLARILLTLP